MCMIENGVEKCALDCQECNMELVFVCGVLHTCSMCDVREPVAFLD